MTEFTLLRTGRVVRLGEKLGGGGEATIYACPDLPDYAAKVYSTPPDRDKALKLAAMVPAGAAAGQPNLARVAAWPVDLLADQRKAICGFIMPRITARRNVHELYSPKSRAQVFPEADFRFLVHVGTNVSRAFAVVHDCGLVVGDVNHGNLLVAPNGTVTLIDCDSFQFKNGSRVYTCDVGTDLFTPPELHGRSLKGLERTANHDAFGLAVLLFHLLFMGRHPFAGRYLGPGEMPIERAIAEYRFAYGANRQQSQMERPPGTVPLETMGPTVAGYFERAFSRAGAQGGRPGAHAWLAALASLKAGLRTCPVEARHHYPAHLPSCPWCVVERGTGVRLFGRRITPVTPAGMIDIGSLWSAIAAMPPPTPDPPLPSERRITPPGMRAAGVRTAGKRPTGKLSGILPLSGEQVKSVRVSASIGLVIAAVGVVIGLHSTAGVLAMLALLGLAVLAFPRASEERRRAVEKAYAAAQAEWRDALRQWREDASAARFTRQRAALEKARAELADLPQEQARRVKELEGNRELRQKLRYLDRFRIDAANIRWIGPERTTMLASWGVETAADVVEEKILQIPNFGPRLTAELLKWRREREATFRFNPDEPVDPQDIVSLNQDFERRRVELIEMLKKGPETLKQTNLEIEAARARLAPVLEKAWDTLKSAQAEQAGL